MTLVLHNVTQGTQEWLELRRGKVTCSNALMLLEKGKYACILENERVAETITPNGNNYAERGHALEEEVRSLLNESLAKSGLVLLETGMITNSKYPDAGYSPDGLICHLSEVDDDIVDKFEGIIEIKAYNDVVCRAANCREELEASLREGEYIVGEHKDGNNQWDVYVGKHEKACADYDNVPLSARMQIQMELLIAEVDECLLILYNPEASDGVEKIHIHRVKPNPIIQKRLKEKLSQ